MQRICILMLGRKGLKVREVQGVLPQAYFLTKWTRHKVNMNFSVVRWLYFSMSGYSSYYVLYTQVVTQRAYSVVVFNESTDSRVCTSIPTFVVVAQCTNKSIAIFTIWLPVPMCNMKRILCSDWLPDRARWAWID